MQQRSIVYNSASNHLLDKLKKIQNKALKTIIGTSSKIPTLPLLIECAEIPLNLNREMNMLKYWTRSSLLGDNLSANLIIIEDPTYHHTLHTITNQEQKETVDINYHNVQTTRKLIQEY